MIQYEQLYHEGASHAQIITIKATLSSKLVLTWEEYYWGTKCLVMHDECESNPELIIRSLKKAFRSGLSIRSNPQIYQDALKMISTFYGMFGKHEQVINHLLIYIDSLGDSAPDWAYHDLITAQMHTDQIATMLENPNSFLTDLARNDDHSLATTEKQKRLFRDFLFCATDFIHGGNTAKVEIDDIKEAAGKYALIASDAWNNFCKAIGLIQNPVNSQAEGKRHPANQAITSTTPSENNVVVNILTDDRDTDEVSKRTEELNKANQLILELRNHLEASQCKITQLEKTESERKATKAENIQLNAALKEAQSKNDELIRKYEDAAKQIKELSNLDNSSALSYQKPSSVPSKQQIIGTFYRYLNTDCLNAGKAWLKKTLSGLSENYMEDIFIPSLTPSQLENAHKHGLSRIEDFDIAAIIRVILNVNSPVPKYILWKMKDIRNKLAHSSNDDPFSKQDVRIMSDFIKLLDGDKAVVKEMQTFAESITCGIL